MEQEQIRFFLEIPKGIFGKTQNDPRVLFQRFF